LDGAGTRYVAPPEPCCARSPADPDGRRTGGLAPGPAHRIDLWVPHDRMVGVIGPATSQDPRRSGPACSSAPGAVVQVATKPDDVLSRLAGGASGGRLSSLGGCPDAALAWDPLHGC